MMQSVTKIADAIIELRQLIRIRVANPEDTPSHSYVPRQEITLQKFKSTAEER